MTHLKSGDRVAYAEARHIPADCLCLLPERIFSLSSIQCLGRFGLMVSCGRLGTRAAFRTRPPGSERLPRPTLTTHTAKREDLEAFSQDLFGIDLSDHVKIWVAQRCALADAAQAHRDLEARKTTGASILVP